MAEEQEHLKENTALLKSSKGITLKTAGKYIPHDIIVTPDPKEYRMHLKSAERDINISDGNGNLTEGTLTIDDDSGKPSSLSLERKDNTFKFIGFKDTNGADITADDGRIYPSLDNTYSYSISQISAKTNKKGWINRDEVRLREEKLVIENHSSGLKEISLGNKTLTVSNIIPTDGQIFIAKFESGESYLKTDTSSLILDTSSNDTLFEHYALAVHGERVSFTNGQNNSEASHATGRLKIESLGGVIQVGALEDGGAIVVDKISLTIDKTGNVCFTY